LKLNPLYQLWCNISVGCELCVRSHHALVGAPLAAPENIEIASVLTKHPPPAGGTLFAKEGVRNGADINVVVFNKHSGKFVF